MRVWKCVFMWHMQGFILIAGTQLCGRLFSLLSNCQRSCVVFLRESRVWEGFFYTQSFSTISYEMNPTSFLIHQVKLFFVNPSNIKSPGFVSGPRFQGVRVLISGWGFTLSVFVFVSFIFHAKMHCFSAFELNQACGTLIDLKPVSSS